ncbi:MAG: SRPBCC family protein [Actinomycetota bacterium]|nr:SRPBCC family protein [Actinomycetota bacterium]
MPAYHTLTRVQRLSRPPSEVFEFFSQAENLEQITPPSLRFRIASPAPIEMRAGALIEYRLKLRGLPIMWLTRIEDFDAPRRFVDVQLAGPYKLWHHTHEFEPDGEAGTLMRDTVRYALPAWPLSAPVQRLAVQPELERIFDYRAAQIGRRF